jgi:hypothetical protein
VLWFSQNGWDFRFYAKQRAKIAKNHVFITDRLKAHKNQTAANQANNVEPSESWSYFLL